MGKIQRLDLFTSNRIAAGEVVERPSSVIKELVENSIDAGSSSIYIEITNAGLERIMVNDNGTGIAFEDCAIAFERHATSKIRNARDLDDIATLGFRGEALSSIAAVARVELRTSTAMEDVGTKIVVAGGEVESCEKFASPNGTSIKVDNLFYNTPARLKFLKKPAQEAAAVNDAVARIIISNPDISIRFVQDGREIYHSSGDGEISSVMYCVYGKEIIQALNLVEYEDDDLPISIKGVVSRSEAAKPNRRYQSFIINGRYVQSQLLSSAVQEAFGTRLMGGKFPLCAIYIEVPFESIDVNVHPNKLQIKFKDEKAVASAVIRAVENSLSVRNIVELNVSKLEKNKQSAVKSTSGLKIEHSSEYSKQKNNSASERYINDSQEDLNQKKPHQEAPHQEAPHQKKPHQETLYQEIKVPVIKIDDMAIREIVIPSFVQYDNMLKVSEDHSEQHGLFSQEQEEEIGFNVIGQVFSTYVLLEFGENLYIIDQHAAHEKMLFDSLKRSLDFSKSQRLIVPYEIAIESIGLSSLKTERDIIEQMGFEVEFYEGLLEIKAIPGFFEESEAADFINDLAEYLGRLPYEQGIKNLTNDKIAMMACKRAIKGNAILQADEMKSLVKRFEDIQELNCPHGRPIIVKITKKDIEKSFKRIV